MNQAIVQDVVTEVMRRLEARRGIRAGEDAPANERKRPDAPRAADVRTGEYGIFCNVDEAVAAASESQKKLMKLSLDDRDAIVKLIKKLAKDNASIWGKIEYDETKIGRLDHKIEKLQILELVPGVQWLKTNAYSGTNGVCLEEFAPFGVIGVITPVTHSVPTLSANAINMIASGNAIVCNPHPSGTNCAAHAVWEYNKAIAQKFGIEHLVAVIVPPTLETAEAIFKHRGIALLVATGGPSVARAALASRKRAIVAGPGNPPVVVDETACLKNAAESIVKGGAYDNNLLCIGEKQVFCVESVFDKLMSQMEKAGGFILNSSQIDKLTCVAFTGDEGKKHVNKDYVGKDASVLADAAGTSVPPATQTARGRDRQESPVRAGRTDDAVRAVRAHAKRRGGDRPGHRERARLSPHGDHPLPKYGHGDEVRPARQCHALCRQRRQSCGIGPRRARVSKLQHRHANRRGHHQSADVHAISADHDDQQLENDLDATRNRHRQRNRNDQASLARGLADAGGAAAECGAQARKRLSSGGRSPGRRRRRYGHYQLRRQGRERVGGRSKKPSALVHRWDRGRMIFTQRQLEALHNGNGQIVLPYQARLSPLAQDWVRRKRIVIGYGNVTAELMPKLGSSSPLPPESPRGAGKYLWWCDGPCGSAKGAIVSLSREANLASMQIPSDAKQIVLVVKTLAGEIKSGKIDGGILLVKSGAVALVLANRCPSLRAVLGTCIDSVEQGIQNIAANVLVIEHPYVTLMQAKNLVSRFIRAERTLSDSMAKLIEEVASCG